MWKGREITDGWDVEMKDEIRGMVRTNVTEHQSRPLTYPPHKKPGMKKFLY